jgi:PBP1b-binding outer membrane lipoprotein LpoB
MKLGNSLVKKIVKNIISAIEESGLYEITIAIYLLEKQAYIFNLPTEMKKTVAILFILILISGCKKTVQQVVGDAILQAMTDGQWAITSFTQNGTDITTSFSGYKFKYYSNKTVDAIKNGTLETTGSWDGDATTMTTSANFSGVTAPLSLVNGTWHITNNSWTYIAVTQTNGSETKTMRLDKQ